MGRFRRAAFDGTVGIYAEVFDIEQVAAIVFEYGCAGTLDWVRAVFVACVRSNRHGL